MATYKSCREQVTYTYYNLDGEKVYFTREVDIYAWYRMRGTKHRERLNKGVSGETKSKSEHWDPHHRKDKSKRRSWKRSAPRFYKRESCRDRRNAWKKALHDQDWDNHLTEVRRDHIDRWRWD